MRAANATGKSTVARLVNGLPQLSATAAGTCAAASDITPSARFGSDAHTACALRLTLPQLRALCQGGDAQRTVLATLGVPRGALPLPAAFLGGLLGAPLLVGVWGNSSAEEPTQWMEVQQREPGRRGKFGRVGLEESGVGCTLASGMA